eukprot:8166-Heterococcus_DN1.PRE.1
MVQFESTRSNHTPCELNHTSTFIEALCQSLCDSHKCGGKRLQMICMSRRMSLKGTDKRQTVMTDQASTRVA